MILKNRGIAFKLNLLILTSVTLIFAAIFTYTYLFTRDMLVQEIEQGAFNLARATAKEIDSVLLAVERTPENVAIAMEQFRPQSTDFTGLIESSIQHSEEIYGATVAFEPYEYSPTIRFFAPYYYKGKEGMDFTYIPYDYIYEDWYQIPKELDRPVWSEPYFDEGAGNILMSTYSVPFYDLEGPEKILVGITTADISLAWLQNIVQAIKIGKTGYGFLITKNGTFVTHPNSRLIMNETIFSLAEARQDARLREIGQSMVRGETGFVSMNCEFTGQPCWMVYAPLSSNEWSLGVMFPKQELMAGVFRLNKIVLALGIVGFFVIMILIMAISGTITRPLRALTRVAEDVATGNLDAEMPKIKSRDEVARLAGSLEYMKTSLKDYIRDLTELTAAKERIESELQIARDIQMGILPKVFPPFPDRDDFDLYAEVEPAKEVGGDLYDFFFLDNEHLCVTLGDVSGKGVPAALFMTITQTLVKTRATQGLSAAEVIEWVNRDLSQENPSFMFVTMFFGIFNLNTGVMDYVMAGHNPPYIVRANGDLEIVESTKGMALGIREEARYESAKLTLQKDDMLFLFTDGVTEAMNPKNDLFSEERLEDLLRVIGRKPIKEVIARVMAQVHHFADTAPQADDITMLALKHKGND
ncbi:MAG: SpoIIE family protein phosphatase [Desulfatibacillum sp.]|nr:SpoIIE family protein phosphatase [Desulfatibacillum sp.]